MVTIENIPVYNATLIDEECGMLRISLVDDPAVMSNFVAFNNDKKMQLYAIANEESRLIVGCVMRADFPIYRIDPRMGEYYIIYKAETIREMAEKYLLENKQNNVNLNHEDGSDVEGVQMVQYFIKDSSKGISPVGFEEIADGSLFAEFHCTNDEVWNAVKEGTYKGFSLEGIFALAPSEEQEKVDEIVESLEGRFSRIFNKLINRTNMSKLSRFKSALLKALTEFANITTDKGILVWDGDEDLKEGDAVYFEDEEGNRTPAEDGDYKTEDNKVIVVVDGKVAEIKDAEAEIAPEVDTPEEVDAEDEDAPVDPEEDEKDVKIKELEAQVEALKAENEALKAEIAKLKGENEEMRKMSASKPAHEEVKDKEAFSKTGNKRLDNLARILSA